MTLPQEHAQNQTPEIQPSQGQPPKGSGLAIAALVVAGISLLLCWIPIVNNLVFVLGLIGLALGIAAWLGARRGRRSGRGVAFAALVISVLSLVGVVATQAFYADVLNDVSEGVDQAVDEFDADVDKATGESTDVVLADDLDVAIGAFTADEDEFGLVETSLIVTVTNKSDQHISGDVTVAAKAADGTRIAEDHAFVDTLSPGQSTQVEIFQFIEEDKVEALKTATFEVVEASVY